MFGSGWQFINEENKREVVYSFYVGTSIYVHASVEYTIVKEKVKPGKKFFWFSAVKENGMLAQSSNEHYCATTPSEAARKGNQINAKYGHVKGWEEYRNTKYYQELVETMVKRVQRQYDEENFKKNVSSFKSELKALLAKYNFEFKGYASCDSEWGGSAEAEVELRHKEYGRDYSEFCSSLIYIDEDKISFNLEEGNNA